MVAFFDHIKAGASIDAIPKEKHISLLEDEQFAIVISQRTTDIENIKLRIRLCKAYLFEG